MEQYILSLDQGTGSSRSFIFDSKANIVVKEQISIEQFYPEPSWVEQDPLEIWRSQLKTIKTCIKKAEIDPSKIKSIGITNQRETCLIWDKSNGLPIYNAIVWQDQRSKEFCDEIKVKHDQQIRQKTGLMVDPYFSASKLKWILDQDPELRIRAKNNELLAGTIDTWLIWKLSNGRNHVTDVSNASRTMLYNISTLKWDLELLDLFDIPIEILPEVKDSDDHFGFFEYEEYEIPISAVLGDQQAALFGQACFEKGDSKCTIGTGAFALMNIGHEFKLSDHGLLTTIAWKNKGIVTYAFEGSIFIAGALMNWFKNQLEIIDDIEDIEDMIQTVDENEVYLIPSFSGLGAPYWKANAKGIIFGMTLDTDKNAIVKAGLESIAFQIHDVLMSMKKDAKASLEQVKFDGGVSENNFLMQFQSNVLQSNISRSKNSEITGLGVGLLAGIKAGFWSKTDLIEMLKDEDIFKPNIQPQEIQPKIEGWKECIQMLIRKGE